MEHLIFAKSIFFIVLSPLASFASARTTNAKLRCTPGRLGENCPIPNSQFPQHSFIKSVKSVKSLTLIRYRTSLFLLTTDN